MSSVTAHQTPRRGLGLVFRALILGPAARHPLRVVLPALGVAVGVAAVAAIHNANHSVTLSFREAADAIGGRSDFVVTGAAGIPNEALASLAFVWKLGAFAPSVLGSVVIEDGTGEIASLLGVDPGGDSAIRDMKVAGGTRPDLATPGSVFVSEAFAGRHHVKVGDRIPIVAGGVRKTVPVAGLLELTGVARAAAGDLLATDIFTAQHLLGRDGRVDRVDIVLAGGVSKVDAEQVIRSRLPAGLTLQPPGRGAATADRMVRAFRFNLNALGSLTLLVGVFLIANAVSISVLRRRPEIATLRAIGTSRAAIFTVFLGEGLVIGAAGTLLGEIGGRFLARAALKSVTRTVASIYLPAAKITEASYGTAAALAAGIGMLVAIAATLWPALEATRVPPSPALRSGSIEGVRRGHLTSRLAAAAGLLLASAAASFAPAIDGFPFFGFAAVAGVVAALALAAPLAVRGVAAGGGRLLNRFAGAPGRLAAAFFGGSLARNGIAVAALAMALGMTLAMIVTVASIRETVRVWVESTLRSDLWIKAAAGESRGLVGDLPESVLADLRATPGVAFVDPFRARDAVDSSGRPFTLASGDFRVAARIGGLPLLDGADPGQTTLRARRDGEVLVSEPYWRKFGISSGRMLTLETPQGPRSFRVGGVYRDYSNDRGTVVLDRELYLRLFDDHRVTSVAVMAHPGVDVQDLRRRILRDAEGRYALSVSTNRDLRQSALRIFDQTFAVTRALEAIAVCVAILGIANALLASTVERRRSFGLLRAIGAAKSQIRGAVLIEAALSAAAAGVMAIAAAAAFAYLLIAVINPQSFGWTVVGSIPVGRLAAACGLVLGAAVIAGILPGRLAASVDPAASLIEE